MSRITIKEIRTQYQNTKKKEKEKKNFKWTYYIRRPISYYIAWPFFRLGISATQVTVLWLGIAIAGCALLASGLYWYSVAGALLLELAIVFDCVDGHLARLTHKTYLGEILDTWAGETLLVLSILSIGIGLSISTESSTISSRWAGFDKHIFFYLGIFAALASLSGWTARIHWRTILMKSNSNFGEPDNEIRSSKKAVVLDNLFHYSGCLTMLMIVSSLLHALDILLVLIAIAYGLFFATIIYRIIRQARSLGGKEKNGQEA